MFKKNIGDKKMKCLTFNFKDRSKTFTHDTVEGAYELFLDNYGEVLNELVDVDFMQVDDKGQIQELSMTAKTFRENYKNVKENT
tara:strand:+ start:103 stop:354 length:252 start_codon:yes stop_codon:yes gene_type:complete